MALRAGVAGVRAGDVLATCWRIPTANHYVQLDQPQVVAALLRLAAGSAPAHDVLGATLVGRAG